MSYCDNINSSSLNNYSVICGFGSTFICEDLINEDKTVTFPRGYDYDSNISFKVVFLNGHNCANASSHLTLNDVPIVVNKYGTLIPLPIHTMTESGNTVYKSLQQNTVLEMYYTDNYDGNNNPAFVVIGNPIVLSSADYTIYADGKVGDLPIGTIISYYKSNSPYGWLICDGGNGSGSSTGSQTFDTSKYAELYAYLGTNKVPDYRECVMVGIGTNSTNTIATHDVYSIGTFKDDCLQSHTHTRGTMEITGRDAISWSGAHNGAINNAHRQEGAFSEANGNTKYTNETTGDYWGNANANKGLIVDVGIAFKASNGWTGATSAPSGRTDDITHGKQKGVCYIIKAL